MTKPNFSKITCQELRVYILAHREEDDEIEALIKRGNPNGLKYRFPETEEDLKEMEAILKRKLDSSPEAI